MDMRVHTRFLDDTERIEAITHCNLLGNSLRIEIGKTQPERVGESLICDMVLSLCLCDEARARQQKLSRGFLGGLSQTSAASPAKSISSQMLSV